MLENACSSLFIIYHVNRQAKSSVHVNNDKFLIQVRWILFHTLLMELSNLPRADKFHYVSLFSCRGAFLYAESYREFHFILMRFCSRNQHTKRYQS